MSRPVPTTAMLLDAPASPPRCAAASMPSARPLTMVSPASLSACAKDSALAMPCAVALRLPTIASAGAVQQLDAALRVEERRRIGDLEQLARILGVGERDDVVCRVFEPARAPATSASCGAPRCDRAATARGTWRASARGSRRGSPAGRRTRRGAGAARRRQPRREAQPEPASRSSSSGMAERRRHREARGARGVRRRARRRALRDS